MQESFKIPNVSYPELEGAICSFKSYYSLPLVDSKFYVTATQEGTGDPSPSNVRNIIPVNKIDIYKTGKNLYSSSDVSGTRRELRNVYLPAGTYTLSADVVSEDTETNECMVYDATNSSALCYIEKGTGKSATFTTDKPVKQIYFYAGRNNAQSVGKDFSFTHIQFEVGSTATAYETYTGQIAVVNLGGNYYGGYYDSITGLFWVTSVIVDLGDFTFELVSNVESPYYRTQLTEGYKYISSLANTMCNKYSAKAIGATGTDEGYFITSASQLRVRDLSITSPSDLNGTKVCYELATPYSIQLSPTEIETLIGQNNIFCNTGNTSLKYIKVN